MELRLKYDAVITLYKDLNILCYEKKPYKLITVNIITFFLKWPSTVYYC